jgi:hypothetical protein
MTPSDTAAALAYDHCARLLEGRAAISPNVDGEHTEAVAQAFERVANTMRECSQALRRARPIDLMSNGASR